MASSLPAKFLLVQRKLSLIFIIFLLLVTSGCRETIIHNLTESEANRLITRLADHSINGGKQAQSNGAWEIQVSSSEVLTALQLIESRRLVRPEITGKERSSKLIRSREEERFYIERALSEQLAGTLETISGVLEARVHLNLLPMDPLTGRSRSVEGGSGSVLIIHPSDEIIDSTQIASLVAGASGLTPDKISVVLSMERGMRMVSEEEVFDDLTPKKHSYRGSLLKLENTLLQIWWKEVTALGVILLSLIGTIVMRRMSKRSLLKELKNQYGNGM